MKKEKPQCQQIFVTNLRSIRNQKGLSQVQLAKKLSISFVHLNNIENGKNFPSTQLLDKICEALQITMKDLFEE